MTEPGSPPDRSVRLLVPDDAPAILELELAAFDLDPMPGSDRAEIAWMIERMAVIPDNTVVAVESGRVVGQCTPRADALTVHPAFRRRGHGRRLVEAARVLVARQGLEELSLWGDRSRAEAAAFIDALGAIYRSSLWQCVLTADRIVPAAVFPTDVVVRAVRPGDDDDRYVELINRAFADHPSPLSWPGDYIREIHGRPDFDPAGVLVVAPASDPEHLVGFCRTLELPSDDDHRRGEIGAVGLLPEWRGRGLGRQLLRWGVAYLRSVGLAGVELTVEARNERALELYRQEGFEATVEWPHWVVPATPPEVVAIGG